MSGRVKCCACGRLVAVLREGSHVRRGAVMVCAECRKRYGDCTTCARNVTESNLSSDIPGFLRDVFRMNEHGESLNG